ncbi:tetratricopeptide repeat protein [Legionella sp. CNM-1927-20]|uniref:tetratricopeptide repeat protein n=1 Tax=Legionella sp. CNM-1927-20 TaxID=3422221 RepID=UPI00403B21AF
MKKVMIIGAGPAGLYTAIKFRKKGLRNIVIYDPRAGNYTRPGHLNASVFERAQKGLKEDFWPENKVGHIKDLEKILYKEAKNLGIQIENKRFIRLHKNTQKPGVVVETENGEEIIEADYVFDCTGTRREVINAVNKITSNSPFQLIPITEPPVHNHFLAYVKMSQIDWYHFNFNMERIVDDPTSIDPLSFTRSIIELRKLGWKEFKLPRCYGMEFGKDKICLYLHAPDPLAKENYDKWVQTVLESYTKPIHYQHLPSSKQKPDFLAFPMNAQALKDVSYKGEGLPTVIALGDAQIDFDYYLAHGIEDGIDRIDALFKHMAILNNDIYYFDSEEYLHSVIAHLSDHKKALISEAEEVRKSFVDALEIAKTKLETAYKSTNNAKEQFTIIEMLKEIKARQNYEEARKIFADYHNESNQVMLTKTPLDKIVERLNKIQTRLTEAHNMLPTSFSKERKDTKELLSYLAISFKAVGNTYFRKKNLPQAIDAYQKALEIYNLDYLSATHITQKLPIYSNLIITCLQNKQYSEAIFLANKALSILDDWPAEETRPLALQEKIIFNLIKASCVLAQELAAENQAEARHYYIQAQAVLERNANLFSPETLRSVNEIINPLRNQFPSQQVNDGVMLQNSAYSALVNLSVFNNCSSADKQTEINVRPQSPIFS